MENTKTVYLITTGEYSDYRVVAVCSTREKAEHVVASCYPPPQEIAEINEWEVDPLVILPPPGYQFYQVVIRRNGEIESANINEGPPGRYSPLNRYLQFYREPEGKLITEVLARTEEHAVKIANEQRLALVAAGLWKRETEDEEITLTLDKEAQENRKQG